ncbi:hypothetical protein E5A73_02470 [Sphingomonas gei]|uniref:Uncharacterized protein n=1 Tax=Sphingomonas gei TaxID=1395960 RepID=A0A4S1XLA7_9SPHN|nr:hypothetical protein [Sphingomonas gei]TGX55996.1 hypothetical protein E5A73_02470 [Sphingomonas gei]
MIAQDKKRALIEATDSRLSDLGYTKMEPSSFRKRVSDDLFYQVQYIFAGQAIVEATPLFGVWLPDIERELKDSSFGPLLKSQFSLKMPTIFQTVSELGRLWGCGDRPVAFVVDNQAVSEVAALAGCIRHLEGRLGTISDVADYISHNYGLAVGHHAFRVPLILKRASRHHELRSYVEYIAGLHCVPEYERFVEDVVASEL